MMRYNKLLAIITITGSLVTLAGCGSNSSSNPPVVSQPVSQQNQVLSAGGYAEIVGSSAMQLRGGPQMNKPVTASVAPGQIVRILNCKTNKNNYYWCQVAAQNNESTRGWILADYLRAR